MFLAEDCLNDLIGGNKKVPDYGHWFIVAENPFLCSSSSRCGWSWQCDG